MFLSVVLTFSSRFWLLAFCFGCFCAEEKTSADSRLGFLYFCKLCTYFLKFNKFFYHYHYHYHYGYRYLYQASYIWETGRNLSTPLTEHKPVTATRNGDVNNHIAELQTKHQIDWDSAACITYSTDYYLLSTSYFRKLVY